MTHECDERQQRAKKSQQDDTEFQRLVSSRACEDWESWQDVCDMRRLEMCYSHVCSECDSQVDNNNKNTEHSFQLCWDVENWT